MESADLQIDEDGNYEIFLGGDNTQNYPNFLKLPEGGSARLIVRQLHNDWNAETEQSFQVEVLSNSSTPVSASVFNDKMMGRRGLAMGMMIRNNINNFRDIILDKFLLNDVVKPSAASIGGGGGFPSNITTSGRYEITKDQALIIEADYVPVAYQNIQLSNLWGESLDYATRTVSYNGYQAYRDNDEKYRYVIAGSDPGVPNWLDATGHPSGGIFMRWQSPKGDVNKPLVKVVKLSELRANLPESHPVTTQVERANLLRQRLQGYNRRKNPVNYPKE